MVIVFALLFAYSSMGSGQVWEQEIKFTGTKTIRFTFPSTSATGTQQANPTPVAGPSDGVAGTEGDSPPSPFSDIFLNSIQKLNTSWQVCLISFSVIKNMNLSSVTQRAFGTESSLSSKKFK